MEKKSYEAPEIEVLEVAVEQGFATSPVFNGFGSDYKEDWG